jgi:D-alanyl-D-alanine carboxypeptidase
MKYLLIQLVFILMASQAFPQKEKKSLDSLMSSIYTESNPGATVAILKNGRVFFEKGYGIAELNSKRAITLHTNLNIGSVTKQFTAYSILKLAGDKKLSLDDKIGKYFPDFNPEIAGRVTIRNLLTHSSGIVEHYTYVDRSSFTEFWDKDVLNAVKSVDSVYFRAGTAYRYSNTAFCLLSMIIERVTGITYPEYLRKNIFKPLGMGKSLVIHPGCIIPERATGYEFKDGTFTVSDEKESLFFTTMGDGGIYTSMHDYLKWITAILKGKGLDFNLVQEALTPQFTIDTTRDLSYGFGWFVAGSGNNRVVYHTGSNGGFRAVVFTIPSEKYAVVVLSNRTGIDLEDLVRQINRLLKVDDSAFIKLESLIN